MRFGEYLQQQGICTPDHIRAALAVMQFRKEKLGRVLVELGFLSPKALDSALIQFLKPDTQLSYAELQSMRNEVTLERKKQLEQQYQWLCEVLIKLLVHIGLILTILH